VRLKAAAGPLGQGSRARPPNGAKPIAHVGNPLTALAHELDEVEDFSLQFWRQLGSTSGDIRNEVGCVHVISYSWQAKVGRYITPLILVSRDEYFFERTIVARGDMSGLTDDDVTDLFGGTTLRES